MTLSREHYVRLYLEVNSVLKNQDAGTKILDEFPRPTCRSVYTVSDKRLRHGGSGYETTVAAAVAEFVSVTKGSDCCPSPVAFRFAVGKNTSSFWHKAAARSRSLFFLLGATLDRRTRASIEYELKLQCRLIINFHFIVTIRTKHESRPY